VILAVGSNPLKIALEIKEKAKTDFAVVNARMVKPLDNEILDSFKGKKVVTIEENSVIGGFSSMVNSYYLNTDTTIYNFGAKDQFVSHAEIEEQMKNNGLEVENILRKVD
jgi:1-deoxy-D-xylulose-5-phosphate synthase